VIDLICKKSIIEPIHHRGDRQAEAIRGDGGGMAGHPGILVILCADSQQNSPRARQWPTAIIETSPNGL
jgi:hypothetical protein